jgi:hypothetical protein
MEDGLQRNGSESCLDNSPKKKEEIQQEGVYWKSALVTMTLMSCFVLSLKWRLISSKSKIPISHVFIVPN